MQISPKQDAILGRKFETANFSGKNFIKYIYPPVYQMIKI
jgi:hypothetical protein